MDAHHEEEFDREEENDIFDENPFSPESISTTATTKKQKRLTSEAWNHFDRYEKVVDGLTVWKARCKYCKHEYCGNSAASGTGSLMRHATKCRLKHSGVNLGSSSQSTLHFTPDGKVTTWRYDPKAWRESLVVLTAVCDLPIYFGESSAYEKHIKTSFNPSFQTVSARTIRRDITEYFGKRVAALKSEFGASKHCVALTSDIWDSRAHLDYSSVVAHYIDASWTLQKRIIGFRLVDRHTGEVIAESIVEVLTDYGILDRTISITLDNATANAKAMRFLDEPLKHYLHTNFGLNDDMGQLNLLQWWEGHKSKYPVLSQLAKDVYSIPVSTVSSESAFSMAGRIVEERRARLTPEIVEMLTLIKDWELQDDRIERLGPLEDYFIDELDEEDDTPAPTPAPTPTPTPAPTPTPTPK